MSSLLLSFSGSLLWVFEIAKDSAASLKMMTVYCKMAEFMTITICVQAVM